jgi:hypothetical protein
LKRRLGVPQRQMGLEKRNISFLYRALKPGIVQLIA